MFSRPTFALLAAVSLAVAPAFAQDEEPGLEELAGMFFAPPESTDIEHLVSEDELSDAGAFVLASRLGRVERGLGECKTMRYQMETLIGASMGSYSVHPTWLEKYKQCIALRNTEVLMIGDAIRERRTEIIGSTENGEAALRAADIMSRLSVYQVRMKKALKDEFAAQKDFIAYYNSGGTAQPPVNRKGDAPTVSPFEEGEFEGMTDATLQEASE